MEAGASPATKAEFGVICIRASLHGCGKKPHLSVIGKGTSSTRAVKSSKFNAASAAPHFDFERRFWVAQRLQRYDKGLSFRLGPQPLRTQTSFSALFSRRGSLTPPLIQHRKLKPRIRRKQLRHFSQPLRQRRRRKQRIIPLPQIVIIHV